MLLKLSLILCLSFNLMAVSNFKILKVDDGYYLSNKLKKKIRISYSGVPKIIKVKEDNGLEIIEYYSGSYGTSEIFEINNRIVLLNGKIIIDAPYKYLNKKEQTTWKIDHKNKVIEVTDPHGLDQKVKF